MGAILYFFVLRNNRFEKETEEIRTVLDALHRAEVTAFESNHHYDSGYDVLNGLPDTRRPTVVGVFPDCKTRGDTIPHVFLGAENAAIKSATQKMLNLEAVKGKCSNFEIGFLGFVAQNLDEDDSLELMTVDETGLQLVLLSD